ncbi:plastin-2 fimbrin [Dermatophagoides farinae]|uniref:Plastin-3 n=1 Tax=Dermatophagoides farinae TaxID=6954 RepID=A0A922I8G9_DERFA|nr:plastin-1-like [Dermatophagoides farinae]KAH9521328.1 Plastin-3 [Dermatophagoides farinae]
MDTLTANLETLSLSEEQTDSIENIFSKNRTLDANALKDALDIVGFKLPLWRVRILIEDIDKKKSFNLEKGRLTREEFVKLCTDLRAQDVANSFKSSISKRGNLETLGGMSEASSSGTTHSVRHEEQVAFSDWINTHLSCDSDLKSLLPIDLEGKTLYDKVKDGILLCKIINHSCPDTIDERAINKKNLTLYTKHENLTLALNSAQAIGCNIINIDAHDLSKGRPHLVLGLLWQIIRIGLFNQITIEHCPGLVNLLNDNEEMADLLKLSPEEILIRWVNYQLEKANVDRRISNFTNDIKDSEVYTHLLYQIAPQEKNVNKDALRERDMLEKAEMMLKQADKLGCRSFLTPQNVVDGVYKLNVAFVANLFNNYPGLDTPENIEPLETIEETREEKTYRNWMNSMGVDPYVNWLYSDLADGKIIFQLFDIIQPGIVNWSRVHQTFSKLKYFMEKIENCNYAVQLGKELKFSLVGIAGQDISEGNPTLTLALVWQLMRAYTLSILSKLTNHDSNGSSPNAIVENEIIDWSNKKLREAGKSSAIKNFQDSSISTAIPVIDLIEAIKPGSINYSQIYEGSTHEEKLANAKYAISMARKIGARIYALPEDIAEVKSKMVMTVFACLMARDYIPNMGKAVDPLNNNNNNNSDNNHVE